MVSTAPALREFHRERMSVLADTPADLFAFETMPSGIEVLALAELLREFPDRVAWFSFSCRDGGHLWDGTSVEDVVRELRDHAQVAAVGVNCIDPQHAVELIARVKRTAPGKLIIAYPNAGRGWDREARRWRGDESPRRLRGPRRNVGCCRRNHRGRLLPDDARTYRGHRYAFARRKLACRR